MLAAHFTEGAVRHALFFLKFAVKRKGTAGETEGVFSGKIDLIGIAVSYVLFYRGDLPGIAGSRKAESGFVDTEIAFYGYVSEESGNGTGQPSRDMVEGHHIFEYAQVDQGIRRSDL